MGGHRSGFWFHDTKKKSISLNVADTVLSRTAGDFYTVVNVTFLVAPIEKTSPPLAVLPRHGPRHPEPSHSSQHPKKLVFCMSLWPTGRKLTAKKKPHHTANLLIMEIPQNPSKNVEVSWRKNTSVLWKIFSNISPQFDWELILWSLHISEFA